MGTKLSSMHKVRTHDLSDVSSWVIMVRGCTVVHLLKLVELEQDYVLSPYIACIQLILETGNGRQHKHIHTFMLHTHVIYRNN